MIDHVHNNEDQTKKFLEELLYLHHPDWVSLSSPYRPTQEPIALQDIHLSTWFKDHLKDKI